ncbi:MAG TPA: FAD-dependent oxidoreductase [Chlamydiales bacterium]|nr:FAD-dependent oxidoreductase [Chlamydiales bacterium]
MNIAVIGAGVAGLAAVWYLQQKHSVTLFDPRGIGGGASGISTGLLHPFPGKQGRRSWAAEEGIKATLELIDVAEKALGRPVCERTGVLRLAVTEEQQRDFRMQIGPDAIWQETNSFSPHPALWIPSGMTVYSSLYLQGLWKACETLGAKLEKQAIQTLDDLHNFDAIVLATGAETLHFPECKHLPLKITKGQTLLCRWPEKLPISLLSSGHITPTPDPTLCQIGSTYERIFTPTPDKALELLEKAALFHPPARHFEVVEIKSGVRISPLQGYRPLCTQITPKAWVLTGFGSRGLLYHALLAKELSSQVLLE